MKTADPLLATLPRDMGGGPQLRSILAKDGYGCSLVSLAAGDALPFGPELSRQDHILFVAEGALRVEGDSVTSLLNRHDALHVARGKTVRLRNADNATALVLRVDIPPPPERAPLYTFPEKE